MKAQQLNELLVFAIKNNFPILIKGKPGIGKTDIVGQACQEASAKLIVSHPVVSDPTDYKGLPFAKADGTAHFLPFGELNQLINATERTVFFLDDLGQAPTSVQAAVMQLILSRHINGHKVSDFVTFFSATNRKEDRAGVSGLLEPLKSRNTIVELEVDPEEWVKWALVNNMPVELMAFIRFRPVLLDKFEPTKDITNGACPRTVSKIGSLQVAGLSSSMEFEAFQGTAGEAFAAEYCGFLKMFRNLPDVDQIILNPSKAKVPEEPATLYAISGALASRMNEQNIGPITQYMKRLPGEISVVTMKDAITRKKELTQCKAFISWASENGNLIL